MRKNVQCYPLPAPGLSPSLQPNTGPGKQSTPPHNHAFVIQWYSRQESPDSLPHGTTSILGALILVLGTPHAHVHSRVGNR